jgi:hypothetical protein
MNPFLHILVVAYIVARSQRAVQVTQDGFLRFSLEGTKDNANTVLLEEALGAGTHASGNDHGDPLLRQPLGEKTGLVPWGGDKHLCQNLLFLFIDINQGKLLTVTKVR